MIPNGHLQLPTQHALPASVRRSQKSSKNTPEVIALENKNWLIHYHYTRREFGICSILIKEELRKSNDMNEYVNYIQGVILRHEGKIQESLEYFQKCHALNPRGVDNIKQVAKSLFLLGRQKLSLEAFNEAKTVALTPEWDIYHNLGVCCIAVEDITKAKEYLRQAVQLNRQDNSFEALANIHLLQNDVKAAVDIYNAALDISPDNVDLAAALGLLYMKIGEHQKAFEKFGSALARDPQSSKALLALGAMMQVFLNSHELS
ncbi:UNVERIFIED_CONTAM: hypothetical protein PYX00_000777 [Menopon gallinae]|uniref:Bardet-Biedl syndrome 4 n=1 Tax=Menopon gallinae TaxID=328185 RepID=A0AAW2IBU6_9NEOP